MLFRIFRVAAITALFVTAGACAISYSQRSTECGMVIKQQQTTSGHAVDWNRALNEAGPNAVIPIEQLESQYPQTCDPDTTKDLLNCGLLGMIVFSILFFPLAFARFAYSVVRGNY